MPSLLLARGRRSLDSRDDDPLQDDPRIESSSSSHLRPLTSEARLGQRQPSLSGADAVEMPHIFPAPLSVQSQSDVGTFKPHALSQQQPPLPECRAFLPQLPHAKTFAVQTHHNPHDPGDPEDDENVAEKDTDAFKQAMWAGQANILVTVRVRPSCTHDRDHHDIVRVLDHKLIVVLDKPANNASSPQRTMADAVPTIAILPRRTSVIPSGKATHGLRKLRPVASAHLGRNPPRSTSNQSTHHPPQQRSREKRYAFDHVFTAQDGQHTVYHHTTKFLIHGVLHGFNATVFAYGCTGAGKTYTMLGTHDEPGIMALTLDDLFQNIATVHGDPRATVQYKVTVSFLEVYNENIRDLLATGLSPVSEYLDLREDPIKGPVVAGISEVEASNAHDVMKLLRRGHRHRSQEATAANAVSSRSHAVLQVLVEQRDKPSSSDAFSMSSDSSGGALTSSVKYGKLSLVDLAGSERAAVTQNRGLRLIEGANINRSLLALGNCINALGEKQGSSGSGTSSGFVPYRDSKLTRLLKDSLGGNCRTVMIANVSPAAASMEETLNTLKYANRAKNIKTTVTRNVLLVDHHLTAYARVVAELKDEIATLKTQLARQARSPGLSIRTSPGRGAAGVQEDVWTNGKLREARGYIAQCFQQRQRLQCTLVEVDHCVDELTRQQNGLGDEKKKLLANERLPRDLATSMLEDLVGETPPDDDQQQSNEHRDGTTQCERLERGLSQLLMRKTQLVAQLARNHSVMDEFRIGIEQRPLLTTNELLRDLLLMEYRVGDLQVENAVLAMKQTLQDHEVIRLRGQHDDPDKTASPFLCRATLGEDDGASLELELPAPCTEMTRLLTARHTVETETPEVPLQSTRSTTGFAFLDELRDRFYDRTKKEPQQGDQEEDADQERLSPRRQWGIHLNNIRLKKKSHAPVVGSPSTLVSAYASTSPKDSTLRLATTGTSGSLPIANAAPYLQVLKHRRKLQHRNSSTSSSSHKKLPSLH